MSCDYTIAREVDMARKTSKRRPSKSRIKLLTQELRQAINDMDFVASGTLHTRTKVCGRKNCRCAVDHEARHGPYHEWSRRHKGRLKHSIVTPEQAGLLSIAIKNFREIHKLLAQWEHHTANEILNPGEDTDT